MNAIAVYPGSKDIAIGYYENGQQCGMVSVPYPECDCQIGTMVGNISNTFGVDSFDVGITCYGMTASTDKILNDLDPLVVSAVCEAKHGFDKTNYGIIMLASIGAKRMISAYPLSYDILPDRARLSGIQQIERRMVGHTLDHIHARDSFMEKIGSKSVVTCYLSSDEISVAAWKDGVFQDMCNSWDGEGPMTPTRSGFFHQRCVYKMSLSGKFEMDTVLGKVRTNGGLFAHLGTSDLAHVREKISSGDAKADLVYKAMIYQIAKSIGKYSVLCQKPEGVCFTGPLATDEKLVSDVASQVSYIGKSYVAPEMDGLKVLTGLIA
jgi:butyrate kinase